MMIQTCYRHRHTLALLATVCMALMFASVPWAKLRAAPPVHHEEPPSIQVELSPEPPPPLEPVKPPPPEKAPPEPPKPQPMPQRATPAAPVTHTQTVAATDAPSATPQAPHAAELPAPTAAPAPVTKQPEPAPPPVAPPPPQVAPAANLDASFGARIRQMIEAAKSYPTGREVSMQRPEGSVEICVTLARDGSVADANVKDSAGSILLDQAAKRLVGRLHYPAFDENAFKGQSQHEFCIRLKYEAPKN